VSLIVEDGIRGLQPRGRIRRWVPSVEVAVEAREVAARDFEAEPVTVAEDIASGPKVN